MFGNNAGALRALTLWIMCAACRPALCADMTLLPDAVSEWQPGPGAPPAAADTNGQYFACPFPDGADRHFWDYNTKLDLSGADGLELEYTCDNPGAFQSATWYCRAGQGWRAAALPVRQGRVRHWIPKADFENLDTPAAWRATSGFRISPWSAGRGPGRLILHAARARTAAIAVVRPGPAVFANAGERAFGARAADWMGAQLAEMGAPCAMLSDADLTSRHALDRYQTLILPCHPHLNDAMVKNIQRYLDRQGRLVVCYNGDAKLGKLMGVEPGAYTAAGRPGRWHAMCFPPTSNWLGPPQVFQGATANLITAAAAGKETKTLAWWCDARGRRQPEAACLRSPQGAWITHVLQEDDAAAQRRMLAVLLDQFAPGILAGAARQNLDNILAGSAPDWEHAADGAALRNLRDQARAVLAAGEPAAAWRLADKLSSALDVRAAARMPELGQGWRGIWVGAEMQADDWRRLAPELAAAGLTDVFLNVPRSGMPDQAAFEACRRHGLRTHIWHICWNLDGLAAARLQELEQSGRLQQSVDGAAAAWLCPAQTRNREQELARLEELADAVEADGMHLDYVRYPDSRHCFCPACRKAFLAAADAPETADWPASAYTGALAERYRAWRARQISEFVNACSQRLRRRHPRRKISAAVYSRYPDCIATEGQDWGHWLRENTLDFVCPMNYTANPGEFAAWTAAQTALPGAAGRVAPGIGAASSVSRLTPLQTLGQARSAMHAGAAGYVIYALNHGLRRDLLTVLKAAHQPRPAPADDAAATKHAQE